MLVDILAKLFIKDYQNLDSPVVRSSYTRMTNIFYMSMMGAMGVVKFIIGSAVGSLAITSSSWADFSDVGLAIMMMVSFKLAAKKPDAKHPFGYARIEYITGMIVSLVIFLLGTNLLKSSVDKIITPSPPEATVPAYVIMLISVAVNVVVFSVNKGVGKRVNSVAVKAAATKNIVDGIASAVVVASLAVYSLGSIDLDGYVGLMMSGLIIYSALMSLKDTVNPLLGLVPDLEFSQSLADRMLSYPEIQNVHDQVIHNYGNNRCYVSAHVEVSRSLFLEDINRIICDMEQDFFFDGIHLTIHVDTIEDDEATAAVRSSLMRIVQQLHIPAEISDLRLIPSDPLSYVFFALNVAQGSKENDAALKTQLIDKLTQEYPDYQIALQIRHSHVVIEKN